MRSEARSPRRGVFADFFGDDFAVGMGNRVCFGVYFPRVPPSLVPSPDSVDKFAYFNGIRCGARRKVVSALEFSAESSQERTYGHSLSFPLPFATLTGAGPVRADNGRRRASEMIVLQRPVILCKRRKILADGKARKEELTIDRLAGGVRRH